MKNTKNNNKFVTNISTHKAGRGQIYEIIEIPSYLQSVIAMRYFIKIYVFFKLFYLINPDFHPLSKFYQSRDVANSFWHPKTVNSLHFIKILNLTSNSHIMNLFSPKLSHSRAHI